jgi:DNA-binding LacI/PurR family transcriptional regulator
VFCANDILAIGFMDAARREFGLDIPGDLSVVGFDDIAMARWPSHALTTVRQPVGKMIDVTMQLIEMLFDSAQLKPRIERIPGELVERASTREVHHAE